MIRVPELSLGLWSTLKLGGIVQPLFSAFGDESLWTRLNKAGTAAIVAQKKHVPKVRQIRDRLLSLRHVIVVDADTGLREGKQSLDLEVLRATFQTIGRLTRQCGDKPCDQLGAMPDDGWGAC